jgi:tetratricopeptide (TPR) repeat protein
MMGNERRTIHGFSKSIRRHEVVCHGDAAAAVRCFLVSLCCGLSFWTAIDGFTAEAPAPSTSPRSSMLEDVPQPLAQQEPRTEAQDDHLEAVARFAAGTMHERREEYEDALRSYQRALRCDPKSATVARAIVPMAVRLKHYSEAVRYAMKALELEDADPMVLRRLGSYLAEEGDWSRALTLYEKAMANRDSHHPVASDVLLWMEMGRLYYLTDQNGKAAECFGKVLQAIEQPDKYAIDPPLIKVLLGSKPGLTYQLMGECFLAVGKIDEAKKVFEKADQTAPDKALQQFNGARLALKAGKPAEALTAIEASLAGGLTDQGALPYETLAEALAGVGKKDELLGRLEKFYAGDPKNLSLGRYLASQCQAAGDFEKAERLYRDLLTIKPMLVDYRSLVELERQNKQYGALLDTLGEAVEKTSVLDILGAEAQTISADQESLRGIVDAARAKMQSKPDAFGYGQRLAVALLSLEAKQYETAEEFFNLALASIDAQSPEPKKPFASTRRAELLMAWGVGLLLGDRPAKAAEVFQRGIDDRALPDDNPAFYFYLAGARALSQRTDDALKAAAMAAKKNPSSARFAGRGAWILYLAKRYNEAERAYRKLLEQFDADHASTETRDVLRDARLSLSNIAVTQGDMLQAEEWLEQVLDEFPDDVGASNDLGYLWADENKHLERAERMIRKAVDAEPKDKAYRDSLGWVLFRLGRYPEALAELQMAATAEPADGVVLDHLGDVYEKLNRRDDAVGAWRKAVDVLRKQNEAERLESVEKKIQKNIH